MVICGPCIFCCSAPPSGRRPKLRLCCAVLVPRSIGSSRRIAQGSGTNSARRSLTRRGRTEEWRYSRPRSNVPSWRFCTACRACVDGVGRGGVVPPLPWNSIPGARLRCPPRRCGAGYMRWTGSGSGPNSAPKMTIPSGWRSSHEFATRLSSCGRAPHCSLPTS